MKKKNVMFSFKDGEKEVSVGDKFYSFCPRKKDGIIRLVTEVGRKYIKAEIVGEDGKSTFGESEFLIDRGDEKSAYNSGESAYSSKEAFINNRKQIAFSSRIREHIYRNGITYNQAKEIGKILGIGEE
jgi:hypothetical protein